MQMTRTTPLRLMILQLRQIRLTEALTFILLSLEIRYFKLLGPEHNAGPGQVVWRQLYRDLVTGQDADIVHPHFTRNVAKDHVAVFQLNSKRCIRKVLENLTLHLYNVVFCHGDLIA
jgi:hypothetical protein